MKFATTGLLWACVLIASVYLDGVSGRRGRGGSGFRFRSSSRSVRRSSSTARLRVVPILLLTSSRRRRISSSASSFLGEQQCQRCTTSYIYQDSTTSYFMTGTSTSPGSQEVSICRNGTAACNNGACSINYLWANSTITEFPDGVGGADPAVGSISAQVESVLICGTLQLAPTLQVTILAVAMATVMQMFGGT